ncbi:conserved hypothetical protein [Vibrio chagasii]|nr:conserved hypothetical protein [Vibrio chagasii]
MSFDVSTIAVGLESTMKALNQLADERGRKWKKKAMMMAGKKAFKPVVSAAITQAPRRTGLTKAALASTKGKYNPNATKKVTARGKIRKGGNNEYFIATTTRDSYANKFPLNSKGQRIRYPFILELGVKPGVYQRQAHVRNGHWVKAHQYNRIKPRNPFLFQHRALDLNKTRMISIWTKQMDYYISLYSKTTYKSLNTAIKAHERSMITGRKSSKWV